MNFYLWAIIITELLMIAMLMHVANYSGFTKEEKKWYILTFVAVMLCAGCEFAVHCGYYNDSFKIPLIILTIIQFSVAPFLGILFTGALGLHKQAKIASIFFSINFLIEVVAAPFGWIFFFNEAGYNRGDAFIIYELFYFISLIYLLVCMIIVGRKFNHRDFWTIGMILVVLIAGIIPMTFFKINITYTAIGISASICYIYYNDLVQQDLKEELIINQEVMSRMQEHMISGLANLIENRDMETGTHISRTSAYVKLLANIAKNEGLYPDELDDHFISLMYTLAPMHDIGKIVIPDNILKKPGKLTDEEFEKMKTHASFGGKLVHDVLEGVTDKEYIKIASNIASYHHERWDGTGYPSRLRGEQIPLEARIMAIVDVYDALISERCYKDPISYDEAFEIIRSELGSHFDPLLTEVFLNHREEFINVSKS